MLLSNLDILATAPGGVARLRELILTLAVQGKLVPQDPADEPASVLLQKTRAEKDRLIAEGKIRRDKPLAEMAEEEKPFELPMGWEWVKGRDLFTVVRGVTYQKADAKDAPAEGLLPILRANNIRGSINFDDLVYVPASLISEDQLLRSGDYVVCLASGSKNLVGKAAPFRPEVTCSFGAFCGAIRPITDAAYFAVYLASPMYRESVSEASAGIGINNLKGSSLLDLDIALPPLAEQSRIVTRVEELMRLCDALEAKGQLEAAQHAQLVSTMLGALTASATPEELADHWQRVAQHFDLLLDRPAAIDALEQTLLQLAVRGLLVPQDPQDEPASALLQRIRAEKDRLIATGQIKRDKPLPPITDEEKPFELPVGWEWVRFGEYFFELCTGPFGSVIHKEDYVEDGIPLINPSHMIGGRISHDPSVSVSQEMSKQLGAYRLTVGDVVLARRGEVGRYALVTEAEDGWLCGTGSFFVKLQESCNREFFGLVLEDPDLRRHLQGESVGSTMVNLNQRILLETPMALPPLAEQSCIVTRVTALRRLCADLRQRLAERQSVQARLAEALVANNAQTSTQQEDECHAA
ncbi:restriction endonuclease subunit S [Acidovorax sp.]|jgi:type I restriction enzyme S subunit|uniref:restriction endonuclease subunit S n=1 Tax=Acidovorax sp. TaxID=1872122 RepID=UPI0025C728F2|nr:restriction endonuclease subunit S [Acidovorax sp.]